MAYWCTLLDCYNKEHQLVFLWGKKILQLNLKIPGILWNPKIHCRVRNILLLVVIMCHSNPVHAPSSILILYSSLLLGLTTSGLATQSQTCIPYPSLPPTLLHHCSPLPPSTSYLGKYRVIQNDCQGFNNTGLFKMTVRVLTIQGY